MKYPSLLFEADIGRPRETTRNGAALAADLNLSHILAAMAQGDPAVRRAAGETLLAAEAAALPTIRYRQEVLSGFLRRPSLCESLYGTLKRHIEEYDAVYANSLPSFSTFISATAVLKDRAALLRILLACVAAIREIIGAEAGALDSPAIRAYFNAFTDFFPSGFTEGTLRRLGEIETACDRSYASITAGIGTGFKGDRYVLQSLADDAGRRNGAGRPGKCGEVALTSIGIQAQAGKLRDAALSQVSQALKGVIDTTLGYLKSFRYDLAFYLGCVNLHGKLKQIGVPLCFPDPLEAGSAELRFTDLVDVSLALENRRRPVGNTMAFGECRLLVVTGANQGGKSTFIRSLGAAQLMMQCGMFVGAESFCAGLRGGVHTHFCRSESAGPDQGRLREELGRMSEIVDHARGDSLVLMNESLSTAPERQASAIAAGVLRAFCDTGIRTVYVTHFYEFARMLKEKNPRGVRFLVAQRNADGSRPYVLAEATPERTSYALDIYREVFGEAAPAAGGAPH